MMHRQLNGLKLLTDLSATNNRVTKGSIIN